MTDLYLSYEGSKLLATKNYSYNPEISHWRITKDGTMYKTHWAGAYVLTDEPSNHINKSGPYEIPRDNYITYTRAEVRAWLRDTYKIDIEVLVTNHINGTYHYKIIPDLPTHSLHSSYPRVFSSYESAEEDAIKYVLENLI